MNPDEALHFLIANQGSWREAYRGSLTTAHPPLLIFLLYFWRGLGTSEVLLRLPSVLAGTAFCAIYFRWLSSIFGRTAGWIGFIFVAFLPRLVELSAEVRQYMLLLVFITAAAYFLELALSRNSPGAMWLSAAFLYLGMLSHYSGFLFAAAIGVYALLRLVTERHLPTTIAAWVGGQIGALAIAAFLYVTHLSQQKSSVQASQAIDDWLRGSFYHPGHGNWALFVPARTFSVFQFTFGWFALGDIAGLLFIVAVVILLRGEKARLCNGAAPWVLGVFLLLPFALNCVAAIARAYPYGGTRHCVFLAIFAIAGVSFLLARLLQQQTARGVGVAVLVVLVCNLFGELPRPNMLRRDQSRQHMNQALDAIHQQISPSDAIFTDYETTLLLSHYLCPQRFMSFEGSIPRFQAFSCAGYRVIFADTWKFTPEAFPKEWLEMIQNYDFKPSDRVWVVQQGWDAKLAGGLPKLFPQLRNLNSESFGKNITMFPLSVDQPMPGPN